MYEQVTTSDSSLSAHRQQTGNTDCLTLAIADTPLERIVQAWDGLSIEIKGIVESLCLQPLSCDSAGGMSPVMDTIPAAGNRELAEIVAGWAELLPRIRQALLRLVRWQLQVPTVAERAGGQPS